MEPKSEFFKCAFGPLSSHRFFPHSSPLCPLQALSPLTPFSPLHLPLYPPFFDSRKTLIQVPLRFGYSLASCQSIRYSTVRTEIITELVVLERAGPEIFKTFYCDPVALRCCAALCRITFSRVWSGAAKESRYTPSKGYVAPTFSALKGGVALQVASLRPSGLTTKISNNKIRKSFNFIVMDFPRKNRVLGEFSLNSNPSLTPSKGRKIY